MEYEEIDRHAQRIAAEKLKDIDFSDVYEDEQLEDYTEEDWQDIHNAIVYRSVVTISEVAQ